MAQVAVAKKKIPVSSWVLLVLTIGLGVGAVFLTHGTIVAAWLRWTVTIAWIAVTIALGLYDFILGGKGGGPIDKTPIDRWTISHGGAGLVFGVWYVPLLVVLVMVVVWEFFERFVPGFGDEEIFMNRVVDVGIAMVLWLLVVGIAAAATGASFPILSPVRTP